MTAVIEKNGVMVEKIFTGNFRVYAQDTGVTLAVVEKGYREGYGVYEADSVKYHYFDLTSDDAKAEFEDILTNKYGGSLDFITFDENVFDELFKNFIESVWWHMAAGCEEKLDEFLTFAIGLNNINKG